MRFGDSVTEDPIFVIDYIPGSISQSIIFFDWSTVNSLKKAYTYSLEQGKESFNFQNNSCQFSSSVIKLSITLYRCY